MYRARRGHQSLGQQALHANEVRRGPVAPLLPRREALRVALSVDRLDRRVDPAVAERLLDCVAVWNAEFSAPLLVVDEPDLALGRMMLRQPRAPRGPRVHVDC